MRARILLVLLLLGLSLTGFGQEYRSSNSIYFLSSVTLGKGASLAYRYQVSIRTLPADTTAKVHLMVMQVGKPDFDFKKKDQFAGIIRPTEWHTYTIENPMKPGVHKLWLYFMLDGNGTFSFDNLTLQVQGPDKSWQTLPLENGDFEHSTTPFAGYVLSPSLKNVLPPGITAALVPGESADKSQALRITMTGGKLVKAPIWYGQNKMAGKYCQLKGVKLYYETYGAGEPLLLLHGNGESISSFSKQIEALAQQYKVIAVDTRAQGKSVDTLTAKLTYELFAEDMKTLLDSLHLPKAHILGWSDGGNTGLLMALYYPTYVNKLVTMGANLFPSTETVDSKMLRQSEQAQKMLDKKGDLKRKRLLTLVLTEPHMSYVEIEAIKAPTLVLAGEKDIIKEAHTKAIAAHIPGAQVVIIKGVSHYAPQENPALFNETVLRFLTAK